ncbi:MAG: sterol desaturase family protein [Bdellovibrionota bacterium]
MEAKVRLIVFLSVLAGMLAWEHFVPRRVLSHKKLSRWLSNLGLNVVGAILLRLTVGAAAYQAARFAEEGGWGLLNNAGFPPWLNPIIAFLVLDFAIYLQHVLSHALPVFWRLHRVHHSDLDFDTTTGIRFHPIEILVSMLYKAGVVVALGAPPGTVLVFEIVLNASSLFNHGNVHIPEGVDRFLRLFLVTPDMHRVHHSSEPEETNSNFGFSTSLWDRLCGTYRAEPAKGQLGVEIGLREWRHPELLGFFQLFILPFRGWMGQYSFQKDSVERP